MTYFQRVELSPEEDAIFDEVARRLADDERAAKARQTLAARRPSQPKLPTKRRRPRRRSR